MEKAIEQVKEIASQQPKREKGAVSYLAKIVRTKKRVRKGDGSNKVSIVRPQTTIIIGDIQKVNETTKNHSERGRKGGRF